MHFEARVLLQPGPYLWMLVRGVIVGDQMQVEAARRLAIDLLEKAQPFDMGMVRLGPGYQFPVSWLSAANNVTVPWRT